MSLERQMIKLINVARQNPTYFVPLLEKQISSFTNEREMPLTDQIIYETNQGRIAWIEALNFLKMQKPLQPLQQHQGLNSSAKDHANDLSKNNIFGHTGSDGSNFSERILRYCRKGPGSMAELIGADFAYENRNHAELTILGLIIDDGVPDRGHRKTIFNPSYKQIGCKSEVQGEKIITVFNITESKLGLRTGTISQNLGNLANGGMTFAGNKSNELMRNTTNDMRNTGNSMRPNQNEDKYSKTEWIPEMSFERSKQGRKQNTGKQSRPFKENINKQYQDNIPKDNSSHIDKQSNSTQPKQQSGKNGISGPGSGSNSNKKLKQKKQTTRIYYEQGAKVTETVTRLMYIDGSVEERIEKHTVYPEQ